MKRNLILKIGISAVSAIILSGCSGVDEERLVQLTGNMNFQQVKQSYLISLSMDQKEDAKVYAYWLEENGEKAEATFDADNFIKKANLDHEANVQKLKDRMVAFQNEADALVKKGKKSYAWLKKIKTEKRMASLGSLGSAFIKNTYYPFLKKIEKQVRDIK